MNALPPPLVSALQALEKEKLPLKQPRMRAVMEAAHKLYGDAMHQSGLTLMEHVMGVLQLLLPFQPDADTVTACLLQHAIDRKTMSAAELQEEFGPRVRAIVSGVHLLSRVNVRSRTHSVEELRLMLLSIGDDIGTILILLCNHCFSLEHLTALQPSERKRIAHDALNISAPVAARLGIHTLKQRLENLAFPVVYPSDSERITEQLT
jgi:(p)ppGpp synthase/HD superfamily hydrolase